MSYWLTRVENAPPQNYNQLLYDATVMEETAAVEALCLKGALVVAIGEKQDTALHYAAKHGLPEILSLLVKTVVSVDVQNKKGETPLAYAAAKGHAVCLSILLNQSKKKPRLDVAEAFSMAVSSKQKEMTAAIFNFFSEKYGEEVFKKHGVLFNHLAIQANKEMIEFFLDCGFNINGGTIYDLSERTYSYQNKIDLNSLQNGTIAYSGCLLTCAVAYNHQALVEWLVEKGAKIDIPVLSHDHKVINLVEYALQGRKFQMAEFLKAQYFSANP